MGNCTQKQKKSQGKVLEEFYSLARVSVNFGDSSRVCAQAPGEVIQHPWRGEGGSGAEGVEKEGKERCAQAPLQTCRIRTS